MVCIYCQSPTHVVNSRHQRQNNHIWRRRKCQSCRAIFSTQERPLLNGAVMVATKGKLQPLERDRLFLTIYESCRHRKHAVVDATALTDIILSRVLAKQQNGVIARDELAQTAKQVIRRLDKAAATSYDAYHPII